MDPNSQKKLDATIKEMKLLTTYSQGESAVNHFWVINYTIRLIKTLY